MELGWEGGAGEDEGEGEGVGSTTGAGDMASKTGNGLGD
jgi:hypothetical protein